MMNFKYHVTCFANGGEVEIRTNNITTALDAFFSCVENGTHAHIVDGTTGEVLAVTNAPGDEPNYATEEMCLMMLGYFMASEWGEATAPVEPVVAPLLFDPWFPCVPANEVIALPSAEGLPS